MDFDTTIPIYLQIIDMHKRALMAGELKPGEKILSQRDFAERYNVNPNTVQRAYREMEALGLVQTLRGQGTFVAVTEEMLETMRTETAHNILQQFVQKMKTLGFTLEQSLKLVEEAWPKEEEKNYDSI
ncbi:MAG: GntR family transcriptional regulator [Firmicutes bacterium]|nr:GntR family transcriptional regulator [Bacillota bacterium]